MPCLACKPTICGQARAETGAHPAQGEPNLVWSVLIPIVQFLRDCETAWNRYFSEWHEQMIQEGIYCEYDDYGNLLYCDRGYILGLFCELAGLECDANGMILRFDLTYFALEGSIPASISNLRELTDLYVPLAL
ncbi:unnamed protein product [Closterium sp. NIES-64]|nr:unnamed protein product [Closterium sp. NIES-64]